VIGYGPFLLLQFYPLLGIAEFFYMSHATVYVLESICYGGGTAYRPICGEALWSVWTFALFWYGGLQLSVVDANTTSNQFFSLFVSWDGISP